MDEIHLINKLAYHDEVYGRLRSGGFVQLGFQRSDESSYRCLAYFLSDGMVAHLDACKFLSVHAMVDQSSIQWISKELHCILDSGGKIWRCFGTSDHHPIQVNHAALYRYLANPGAYSNCTLMVDYTLNGEDD